jgi:hypothetical protein
MDSFVAVFITVINIMDEALGLFLLQILKLFRLFVRCPWNLPPFGLY